MKTRNTPAQDVVIREVRDARARLWKEGGGTIRGFIEAAKRHAARIAKRRSKGTPRSL